MLKHTVKTALLGSVMVAGLMAAMGTTPAAAGPLGMSGGTTFHFRDWEDTVDTTTSGNGLSGIIQIDNIVSGITLANPSGSSVYAFGAGGPQIVGYFTGLTTIGTPTSSGFRFTGGEIKLYYKASCTVGGAAGSDCFNPNKTAADPVGKAPIDGNVGAGITDGQLVLDLVFSPPNVGGAGDTLDGSFSATCVGEPFGVTVTQCGSGSSFLDTLGTVAAWNKFFDTNSVVDPFFGGSLHDLSLQNTFFFRSSCVTIPGPCTLTTQDGWAVTSDDPVSGTVRDVPEPLSLSMFGMGLLGLGFMVRRRAETTAKA